MSPIKIDRMLDLSAREILVTECSLKGQNVFFSNLHLENHETLIRYNSGFTEENLPADLEECIMNVFVHKSKVLRKRIKGGLEANEYSILNNLKIPEDIKEILEPYYWKWSLFSGNEITFAGNFGKCRKEKNALCKNGLSFFWGVWILRFMANGKSYGI